MKPIIAKPIAVAMAIFWYSEKNGLLSSNLELCTTIFNQQGSLAEKIVRLEHRKNTLLFVVKNPKDSKLWCHAPKNLTFCTHLSMLHLTGAFRCKNSDHLGTRQKQFKGYGVVDISKFLGRRSANTKNGNFSCDDRNIVFEDGKYLESFPHGTETVFIGGAEIFLVDFPRCATTGAGETLLRTT
uniref:Uncharacterized protein n=1 Tax=Romanomermis culicivorax TaxID=13658 RepID=A0A915I2W6_ROMCU